MSVHPITAPRGRPPVDPTKRAIYDLRVQALALQRQVDELVRSALALADHAAGEGVKRHAD